MAETHTTFTPSSLLLVCSLLHLLTAPSSSLPFRLPPSTLHPPCALITLHLLPFRAAIIAVSLPFFLLPLSRASVLGRCLFVEEGTPSPYALLQKVAWLWKILHDWMSVINNTIGKSLSDHMLCLPQPTSLLLKPCFLFSFTNGSQKDEHHVRF